MCRSRSVVTFMSSFTDFSAKFRRAVDMAAARSAGIRSIFSRHEKRPTLLKRLRRGRASVGLKFAGHTMDLFYGSAHSEAVGEGCSSEMCVL
jgi:hypothetical protein